MDVKTRCIHGGRAERGSVRPLAPTIVPSSTFVFETQAEIDRYHETGGGTGYLYSRYGNPTVDRVEALLAALEEGEAAACFASGMAAISTTLLTVAGSGQRIAAQRELYGGTADLLTRVLPSLGIETLWLSRAELEELEPGRLAGCRLLLLETPVNPTLRLIDLRRAAQVARSAGVPVAVDSTFATPVLQRPLALGADLVLHSATKYLGGHSDLTGGAVVGRAETIRAIALRRRALGGIMDPFTAFLLHRGMRSLAVRMEAHCRGAQGVAEYLVGHPRVTETLYPGLPGHADAALAREQMGAGGGMVSFAVAGPPGSAERVHDRLRLFARAGSLGGVESLVSLPAKMSHRYLDAETRRTIGVGDNLLRLSVGLESPSDLVADLEHALGES